MGSGDLLASASDDRAGCILETLRMKVNFSLFNQVKLVLIVLDYANPVCFI